MSSAMRLYSRRQETSGRLRQARAIATASRSARRNTHVPLESAAERGFGLIAEAARELAERGIALAQRASEFD
jgi:hypothetical protein